MNYINISSYNILKICSIPNQKALNSFEKFIEKLKLQNQLDEIRRLGRNKVTYKSKILINEAKKGM